MDRKEILALVMKRVRDNYEMQMSCSESIFEAILSELDTGLPPETLCVVSGFGSGGGLFGGTCGALNGAIAAVGLAYGRRYPPSGELEEKRAQLYGKPGLYRIFNRLPHEFNRRFGTTLCRELTEPWHEDWFNHERRRRCLDMVIAMGEMAAEMVFPQDKEYWESQPFGHNLLGFKD
jgi:C_GCAxxG_C_C family probable redox protein